MATASISHNSCAAVAGPPAVRPAEHHTLGIRTFYVASDSQPGVEYAVQHIRKQGMNRWQCSCPQFFFRCAAKRRHCKHIHFVRQGSTVSVANAA
jgi:hypothetical protein